MMVKHEVMMITAMISTMLSIIDITDQLHTGHQSEKGVS